MNRLRPRTTVISGAALGLIAGAAVYGAVSSASASASTSFKPALVGVATAPATAARCAAGQELEHGVCIVHVERPAVGAGIRGDDHGVESHHDGDDHGVGSDHNGDDHGDSARS